MGGDEMIGEWITQGFGIGVVICAAGFTVLAFALVWLVRLGLALKRLKEDDNRNEKNRPRPD